MVGPKGILELLNNTNKTKNCQYGTYCLCNVMAKKSKKKKKKKHHYNIDWSLDTNLEVWENVLFLDIYQTIYWMNMARIDCPSLIPFMLYPFS